jgi:RND family efflux transporter MFP subunit
MKKLLRVLLPLLILVAGIGVARHFLSTRPETPRKKKPKVAAVVETRAFSPISRPATVEAMGAVMAARAVVITPEVSGRVVEHSPRLIRGGRFSAGDLLARVEPRDYELAVAQAKAQVVQAGYQLKVEEQRGAVAEREWELFDQAATSTKAGRDMALRKPHRQAAQAALSAARSGLATAELAVQRTTLTAPFNAFVREEAIELGQMIGPSSRVATLVGTDAFHVQVSVPVDELRWIALPDADGAGGALARVVQEVSFEHRVERQGRVVQLLGELDPRGRMARLLVEVADPLGLTRPDAEAAPLLLGAYVRVSIEGRRVEDVLALPRRVLRSGDVVWVLGDDGRLAIHEVTVSRRGADEVLVEASLPPGARIITSALATPVAGMALRTLDEDAPAVRAAEARR